MLIGILCEDCRLRGSPLRVLTCHQPKENGLHSLNYNIATKSAGWNSIYFHFRSSPIFRGELLVLGRANTFQDDITTYYDHVVPFSIGVFV